MKTIWKFIGAIISPIMLFVTAFFDFVVQTVPLIPSGKTETVERMPVQQTGKGVWSFVTNLYRSQGRTYCWQAGTAA